MKCILIRKVRRAQKACRWLPAILWISGLSAQTCLVLSPSTLHQKNNGLFDLSLYAPNGKAPSAVQWTFQYPASSISSFNVDDGPVLNAAGKTAICAGDAAAYNCLVVGLNTKPIANGVIAKVAAVFAPGAGPAVLQLTNPRASSADGSLIPIVARIQSVPTTDLASDCGLLPRPKGPVGGK